VGDPCPQSPQLGDKGASGKTMLYSIWIGVGTDGDGAVVPRFPARKSAASSARLEIRRVLALEQAEPS